MGGGASKKQQPTSRGSGSGVGQAGGNRDKALDLTKVQKSAEQNNVEDFILADDNSASQKSPEVSQVRSSSGVSKTSSKISPKNEDSVPVPTKGAWDDKAASSALKKSSKERKRPPELSLIETPNQASAPGLIDLPSPQSSEESFCVVEESAHGGLPVGWETAVDQSGRTYFYNKALQVSQWHKPEEQSGPTARKASPKKSSKATSTGKQSKFHDDFSSVLPASDNRPFLGVEIDIQIKPGEIQNASFCPAKQGGDATRMTLFAGIMDNDRSTRYASLQELCDILKKEDDGSLEPEFNLTMITEVMGILMDPELEVRSKAAETALNMAANEAFCNVTLEVILERLYEMLQASQDSEEASDLCSGACILITRALNQFLSREAAQAKWGSDIATSKVHLQAAIWDMTALVQRALNDQLSEAAKESAINLAVAVYLHLGVDESSNLLDGCHPSIVSFLFEKFADAEDQGVPFSPAWGDTPAASYSAKMAAARADDEVFNAHRSRGITANEESLMDDILEEVGLTFDDVNECLVRDKILCSASTARAFPQSKLRMGAPTLDEELAGLGLPDDLMQWTKTVLADDIGAGDNELS